MKHHYSLVTGNLSNLIISRMLRCSITQDQYSELVVDLIHFFNMDVDMAIDGRFAQVMDYSTKTLKSLSKPLITDGKSMRLSGQVGSLVEPIA
jgi:hypothetical protein